MFSHVVLERAHTPLIYRIQPFLDCGDVFLKLLRPLCQLCCKHGVSECIRILALAPSCLPKFCFSFRR